MSSQLSQKSTTQAASTAERRELWVLGCSGKKREVEGELPALSLYDGPAYRVIRSYIRDHMWPSTLSVAVLSARHKLIGALTPLCCYDERMTRDSASAMRPEVTASLTELQKSHASIHLVMGKDYLSAVDAELLRSQKVEPNVVRGPIGMKLHFISRRIKEIGRSVARGRPPLVKKTRPLYFLPDWDDFLDVNFDFVSDRFSAPRKDDRVQQHSNELMLPDRICDGVLVSLAQHLGSKGLLRKSGPLSIDSLAPRSVRTHFALTNDQWAFGDCGAFSYVAAPEPTISVEKSVALYDLFEFDLGASVDHIPVPEFRDADGRRIGLSRTKREERVRITRRNAARFIETCRTRKAQFTPVGVIQGLTPKDYADQLKDYKAFGYDAIALGGLVPRSDNEITGIVSQVRQRLERYFDGWNPWIHLFGVYRPNIQGKLRAMGVNSFDSATYFRKAWLRSDQNYIGTDGKWYAAIRVPPTSDPRTMKRLQAAKLSNRKIRAMERAALTGLRRFADGELSAPKALDSVIAYDSLLLRNEASAETLREKYERTLEARPWEQCGCQVCSKLGIDALVFRGLNRNKRRGAHNTLRLYQNIHSSTGGVTKG